MITYAEASDEINLLIKEAWELQSSDIVGYIPELRWQGIQYRNLPDTSKYWARVSIQTIFEEQASLSNGVGLAGKRRFESSGLVFVQIFCPKSDARAFEKGKLLAVIARDAFRGKSTESAIFFRNVRIQEIPQEDNFERLNIVAEFEYDEIG